MKDVKKDLEKDKTLLRNLKKLNNRNFYFRKKRKKSSKKERNGWKSIKKIDRIKIKIKPLRILSLKIKISKKGSIVQIREVINRVIVNREGLSVVIKMVKNKKSNFQEDLEKIKAKNQILLQNNLKGKKKVSHNKRKDLPEEEEAKIKKTGKDTVDMTKIQKTEDKEMMKCLLNKSPQLMRINLNSHLRTLNQSHD
jgi:hypothetical protein